MKYKAKIAVMLLVALICWAFPIQTLAETAEPQKPKVETSSDYTSADIIIKDNAIQQPIRIQPIVPQLKVTSGTSSGRHSIRAEKQISEGQLKTYLENRSSPLADFASELRASPYWSTIIGICTIEQYGCTRAPGNNYWGIGPGKKYGTITEAIAAISTLLAKYEANGHDTIESLNGYYVQPASQNWLNVVLTTKQNLESLTSSP